MSPTCRVTWSPNGSHKDGAGAPSRHCFTAGCSTPSMSVSSPLSLPTPSLPPVLPPPGTPQELGAWRRSHSCASCFASRAPAVLRRHTSMRWRSIRSPWATPISPPPLRLTSPFPTLPVAALLHQAQRRRTVLPAGHKPIWVTELNWQSAPQSPGGVPPRLQAPWVSRALHRLWVAGVSLVDWQFLIDPYPSLRLSDPTGAISELSRPAGLYLPGVLDGRSEPTLARPKPFLRGFAFPFDPLRVDPRHIRVWALLDHAAQPLQLQRRLRTGRWRNHRASARRSRRRAQRARGARRARQAALVKRGTSVCVCVCICVARAGT